MDWIDIGLHVIGAVAIMLLGWATGFLGLGLAINTLLWPIREIIQHKGFSTSPQSTLEWHAATVTGFVLYGSLYG